MTLDELRADYLGRCAQLRENRFSNAEDFHLDGYLNESFDQAHEQAQRLIPSHVHLLDCSAECLHLFTRFVGAPKITKHQGTYLSQLQRATNCLIVIRFLLLHGLEEACRPISRSFLEYLDISTACQADEQFAERISKIDEDDDFENLWRAEIGYGRIYRHVRNAFHIAGRPAKDAEEYIELRRAQKNLLSSSVHGDDPGAFRSMAPSPLGYPDMISLEPHGVISTHTPGHAAGIIAESFKYLSLSLSCMLSENHPIGRRLPRKGPRAETFLCHFVVYQDHYFALDLVNADAIVAPDYKEVVRGA